jgi:hypothetical protein
VYPYGQKDKEFVKISDEMYWARRDTQPGPKMYQFSGRGALCLEA